MRRPLFPTTPCLNGSDAEATRREIRAYFHATYDCYELLFQTLVCGAGYFEKPNSYRHPLIFYLGHTATFFINKLIWAGLLTARVEPRLESIFAVGVDEMSWDDMSTAHYEWPTVDAVRAYRQQVRERVDQLIATLPLQLPIDWNHPWWVIVMGIEHERIHLETSSVLIRQQRLDLVRPHPEWRPCEDTAAAPQNALVQIPAGSVCLGKTKSDTRYGWDNEYGTHTADVPSFAVGRYLVSNQEFLEFVTADAYDNDSVWEEEGRAWKNYAHAKHPTFWVRVGSAWHLRLMAEEVPMPWDWPVEVNYHEAKAFCNWKRQQTGEPYRLPTEDEWHRLYAVSGVADVPKQKIATANLQLHHYASSCPVTTFRHGDLYDVVGNVWQWTETPIYPFVGFEVHPGYDDFTAPTFDERHNLLMGGSWISSGNEVLKSARYAFRRHFFQQAGFRYVVADTPISTAVSHYETDKLLSEYAEFHYGDSYFGVQNFSQALAQLAIKAMGNKPARKALDLGCAAGRASFELARHFEQVTGVDFSARFIVLGVQLAQHGMLRYTLAEEGDLVEYKERTLSDLGLDAVRNKVEFFQGDACNLKPNLSGYDLILAANLIDRLYSPRKFLGEVHERLTLGGVLMLTSPYTWLAEHTPREEWIGGYKKDGERVTTLDGLKEILSAHFRLIEGPLAVPFVIRETRRKFQHTMAEVTLWERIA